MTTLYLCGAGNCEGVRLALSINQREYRWDRIVLLDDDPAKHGRSILGVRVAGPFAMLEEADPNSAEVVNMVARATVKRWSACHKIEGYDLPFATLIHPSVDIAEVQLGRGITVYQNSTVGPLVSVGEGSVVWMGAGVGQECQLGRYCIVGPHAVVNGRVQLGDGVYVGPNATILPEVKVGAWATIGAGSVAMRDVPAGATIVGVPGRVVYMLSESTLRSRVFEPSCPAPTPELQSRAR